MAIPKNIGKYYVREELGRGASSALEQASNNLRLKFNSTFLKILVKRLAFANTRLAYLVS